MNLLVVMATGLRIEDRLDGAVNFISWKARIVLILQDSELWDIVNSTTASLVTVPTDAVVKATFDKRDIKAKRIIFDAIKNHVIPHISGKDHAYQMWTALTNFYQSSNENQKMVLREKLKSILMNKGENITTYLTRITQVHDELGAIGEVIESVELVRTTLNGVAKPWVVFMESVVASEHMPSWDHLWDEFIQEKNQRGYVQGSTSHKKDDEENADLAAKGKKNKSKKGSKGGTKQHDGEKKA